MRASAARKSCCQGQRAGRCSVQRRAVRVSPVGPHHLVALQQRTDEMEIARIGDLPVRLCVGASDCIGNALVSHRVRAQIGRNVAIGELTGLLQASHESCHCRDVESCGIEPLEADAVGFIFVVPRVIDLVLNRQGLR